MRLWGSDWRLTCPYTLSSVDQDEGDNGHVKLGLDESIVFFLCIEEIVIRWIVDHTSKGHGLCEDITGGSMVFATSITRTILTGGPQYIEIIAAHKVLRQVNDGSG